MKMHEILSIPVVGTKKFVDICPVCGKQCGQRGGLIQHMKVHAKRGEVESILKPNTVPQLYYRLPDGTFLRG